ncbi:unnamed protein product [Polarella glacialis]|uniref:Uncharacterized protein n=1 Tax=Polarella glacialis TaxID=89957 RepID=A0A813HA25_POLGL|nr:unnamed protein product [Polarella glacialis]
MAAMQVHAQDHTLLSLGIQILGDLADLPLVRTAFAACGGWDWLLPMLESTRDSLDLQIDGVRLLAQLCRGGSFGEASSARVGAALEKVLQRHSHHERLLYWGLWAVQQLHGASSLLAPLWASIEGDSSANAGIAVSALKSLGGLAWGQGDGAGPEQAPPVIDAVLHVMRHHQDNTPEILLEGAAVLGRTAAYAAEHEELPQLLKAGSTAVAALLDLLRARAAVPEMAQRVLEAFAEILEVCGRGDAGQPPVPVLRRSICEGLFGSPAEAGAGGSASGVLGLGLLSKVSAEHESNTRFQGVVMWVAGLAHGASAIVREMDLHPSSYSVQMSAMRTLAVLYGDHLDLEVSDQNRAARAAGLQAVIRAMSVFPENVVLMQNGCYALSMIVDHGLDDRVVSEDTFVACLRAAIQALLLSQGSYDDSYSVFHLRQESARLIAAVCAAAPGLGQWLLQQGSEVLLSKALMGTADSIVSGRRDTPQMEEALQFEMLALTHIVGPTAAIAGALQRWGSEKPSVARASADAVAELVRRNHPPIVEELRRGNAAQGSVGAQLAAAMQAHKGDEELQSRLQLALGFTGAAPESPPTTR